MRGLRFFVLGTAAILAVYSQPASAEDSVKIGVVKNSVYGPLFVAESRGYFKAEKLNAELVYFDSSLLMGPAVASGAIDFAGGNATAAIYNLGGQGAVRIIAGFAEDSPGFQLFAFVASNKAYEAGLKNVAALSGHTVAVQSLGAAAGYILSLVEAKYRLDPKTVRELPLQSNSNMISAVTGGTADSFLGPATPIVPVTRRGEAKLLGFSGDEVKWQLGTIYTGGKTANDRHDVIERFLRAYRKGIHDYDDAFVDASGTRRDSADAPAILDILAKHLDQTPEALKPALGYVNAEGKLDVKDILRQIAWYKSQGMIKPEVNAEATIDKRYVVPLEK
jgi:NitT/TauT family transport system substrate-binding protein